jgi:hypothetical protein
MIFQNQKITFGELRAWGVRDPGVTVAASGETNC